MDAGKKDAGKDTGTVVKAPSCMNPTPAEAACDTCQGTMCGTQVKAAIDACNTPPDGGMSYIACYEACDCADKACAAACKFAAPMSCTSVLATSATGCTACATECN
jgi:hypothetical protein